MGAWELNEYIPAIEDAPPQQATMAKIVPASRADDLRPGDDYNERGDVRSVLTAYGWQLVKPGDNERWRRPGKTLGWSATLKNRVFYVFSGNAAPFEPNKAYAPFSVYTKLEHDGNFTAAAKALRLQGFGGELAIPDIDISQLIRKQKETGLEPASPATPEKDSPGDEFPDYDTTQDLLALNIEKIPYSIERVIPCRDICLIAGAGGPLKTWLFLEMMRAHASGAAFLGQFAVNIPGPALLMDKESGRERLALRVRRLGINPQFPLYFLPREMLNNAHLTIAGFGDWMLKFFDTLSPRPTLIGFDSWTRWFRGNENSASEVAAALEIVMDICTRGDVSAVIIDHARKSGPTDRSESRDKIRGSTDKINAVSTAFWVERRENLYAFEEVKGRDYPPSPGALGLRFGPSLIDPAMLEFDVELVPDKPVAKIETVKMDIMNLVNENLGSPLTQAEIVKKMEISATRSTIQRALRELADENIIESAQAPIGRGKSPLITKVRQDND